MGKLRKIAIYLMIPVVIICMAEGRIYYREMGLQPFEGLLCSIDNMIKLFLARPTIQPYLAFRSIDEAYTDFEAAVTYAYSVIVIIAPILMTTAIVAGFSAYVFDFRNSVKLTFKDKLFVIGDGQMSGAISAKYSKEYFVHYLMPSDTLNEERVPLLKEKVRAYAVDYEHMDIECGISKLEKASIAVICFRDWFKSFVAVTDIVEYLIRKNDGKTVLLYIVDAPGVFRNAFENMYHGLCSKYGRDHSVLSVIFLNVNEENARIFFRDPHMADTPDRKHHIIFTGVGGYGRAMLKELIGYMAGNDMTGTIEVFDRSVETSINSLMYYTNGIESADKFSTAPTAKNAMLSVDMKTEAGTVRVNYYQAIIGELNALDYLSGIVENGRITEYFCCIDDVYTSFECYRMIERVGREFSDAMLYFRVAPRFYNAFEVMKMNSPKLEFLPDGLPDKDIFDSRKKNSEK